MDIIKKSYDLVVVGGGLSGMCAAIAAARSGISVALVHNRPVPGGNASSEIRMHICGADYHMSRPNARETGIIEELQLENKHRNPTNSYAIFDSILWEKCAFQENLTLYLNTHMSGASVENGRIESISTVQLTTEKQFELFAPLFVDATGDGTLGTLCGAQFRLGREGREAHDEKNAPEQDDPYTMGNSIMFKARDAGRPVPFIRPDWAYSYTQHQLKMRDHSEITSGYWWIELGGANNSVIEDGEEIRDKLLKSIFGVWDHIKNVGEHGAENMELEWVGFLPGKRESRRLMGDYILNERDCYSAARFQDGVAYGGWPMDVHVVGGFETQSENPTVWIHLDDVYEIPYRSLYSVNVENLFLAGRAISCSHMAFASTRVMATCAVVGEAVGVAAAMATKKKLLPRGVLAHVEELRQELLRRDCYIPGACGADLRDLARVAQVTATSRLPGSEAENVTNGVARTVGDALNCWTGKEGDSIRLGWDSVQTLGEIAATFDSNLSQELTISLSDTVLHRQKEGSPPELVRDYTISFNLGDKIVRSIAVQGNYLRHRVHRLEKPVECDSVTLTINATNGCTQVRVYEIRAYA